MNINIIKTTIKNIINFPSFLISLVYVLIGIILVISGIKDNNYLYIIINSISHIHLIFIFILPPLIIIALKCYKLIYLNEFIDIPSWDKSDLLKNTIITGLLLTFGYYIFIILGIGVVSYIMSGNNLLSYQLDYNISTIYIWIFLIFRFLLFMIMIFILTLTLKYKLKNSKIIIFIFLVIIIFFSLGLSSKLGLDIFDITRYINDFKYTKSFEALVIGNLIFYSITIIGPLVYLIKSNQYILIENIDIKR